MAEEEQKLKVTEVDVFAEQGGTEVSWDQADVLSSKYVKFDTDKEKILTMWNWKLVQRPDRFDPESDDKIFFTAEVTEEDGEKVNKLLDTPSMRLRMKMRPILEGKSKNEPLKISVTKVGEKFQTQYIIKEV